MLDFGWLADLYEVASANERYGIDAVKNVVGRAYTEGLDRKLAWEIEKERLGQIYPSWDQGNIGSCVGQGAARCFQDSLLYEMDRDGRDFWPGEMPSEVAYGGSRVEIGGGRIGGDGSLGIWAAEFLKEYGLFPRKDYGGGVRDLTRYSVQTCRHWGDRGVPDDLEPLAKEHGIKDFAVIKSFDDCLAAWEQGYIGTYVGMEAYETRRGANGICRRNPRDQWPHQQYWRAVLWLKGNQPALPVQNSWGDYLGSSNARVTLESGREIELPMGCYLVLPEDANRQFRSGDSHVYNNVAEWENKRPDWKIRWRISL